MNPQNSRVFNPLFLTTHSGKIQAVRQQEKYISIELKVKSSSLKLDSSPPKGKITLIKKALRLALYKLLLNFQKLRVFNLLNICNVSQISI
uniref:Uncharacterized protein n=1 Tax=Methanosarcina barkeri (strain Fusaro / DSM 804) TaxID=269797 RepID=Q46A18_METBF